MCSKAYFLAFVWWWEELAHGAVNVIVLFFFRSTLSSSLSRARSPSLIKCKRFVCRLNCVKCKLMQSMTRSSISSGKRLILLDRWKSVDGIVFRATGKRAWSSVVTNETSDPSLFGCFVILNESIAQQDRWRRVQHTIARLACVSRCVWSGYYFVILGLFIIINHRFTSVPLLRMSNAFEVESMRF